MSASQTVDEPGPARSGARLTVLSGPSGVGKSSVLGELRRRSTDVFFSVSVTTRASRPGERDGEHYYFLDHDAFRKMADSGQLLEHACYAGNYYGTPREPVERALTAGIPAVLEIELQGARQVRAAMPEAQLVMLLPPSWEHLVQRLTGRGTEDPEIVKQRLDTARRELEAESEFDASVVNSDVSSAVNDLLPLILHR